MIPEKVFQKILVLGDGWRVQQVDYVEKASKVLIRIEETPALWASESCPHCDAKSVGGYDHAPQRTWRHLNVCQLQSEIVCALPRGQCKDCKKVYTVRAPWEGRSRLEPMKKVARMLRAHEELLMNWFRAKGEISSGAVEGLNNKIRVVTRRSYGFRTYNAMEIALYHTLGRLPEPESPHRFC